MFDFDHAPNRAGTGSLKWDKYAGRDILPLWVADMDFKSAPAIVEALQRRLDHGVYGYTVPYESVTDAVLNYLRDRHQLTVHPDWLVWLPGLVQGLNLACRAVGQSGDSVLTVTPVYPPFLSAPGFSDRKRISVPLSLDGSRWVFDWDALERAITPDTRLFNLCHPQNPTGRVWRREDLEQVLEFCARHHLAICSDEIHCDLILDDLPHIPMLALGPRAAERTIALYSPSKTYNLPGLACAFAVIPDTKLRAEYKRALRGLVTEINLFGYAACEAAYRHGEPWRRELIAYLRGNRDVVYSAVREHMPGVRIQPMEATYLAWLDLRDLKIGSPQKFFEDAGVGLSNGVDFGHPGFLRLNFGCPRRVLEEGLHRMARALHRG